MENKIELHDQELYENIADYYVKKDLSKYSKVARKLRLIQTLGDNKPYGDILELGCGAGFTVEYLKREFGYYIGVDYSANLIEYAKKYNSDQNVEFSAKNIKELEFDKQFDIILMIGVLHHVTDRVQTLKHLSKYLKKDGRIVMNEPQGSNLLIQFLRKLRAKVDKTYSEDQQFFKESEFKYMLEQAGYRDIAVRAQGFLLTPLAETAFLPVVLGRILVFILMPFEKLLYKISKHNFLKKLSWNLVIEARPSN